MACAQVSLRNSGRSVSSPCPSLFKMAPNVKVTFSNEGNVATNSATTSRTSADITKNQNTHAFSVYACMYVCMHVCMKYIHTHTQRQTDKQTDMHTYIPFALRGREMAGKSPSPRLTHEDFLIPPMKNPKP